jgi:hypothetical protein
VGDRVSASWKEILRRLHLALLIASCSPHKIAQYGGACLTLLPYAVLIADPGRPDSLK